MPTSRSPKATDALAALALLLVGCPGPGPADDDDATLATDDDDAADDDDDDDDDDASLAPGWHVWKTPTIQDLQAVHVDGDDTIWVAGESLAVGRLEDGTTWLDGSYGLEPGNPGAAITSFAGTATDRLVAGSALGVLRLDDLVWTEAAPVPGCTGPLRVRAFDDPDRAYAVCREDGRVARFDPSAPGSSTEVADHAAATDVWAFADDDVHVLTTAGEHLVFAGGDWGSAWSAGPAPDGLTTWTSPAPGALEAVGAAGLRAVWDGDAWTEDDTLADVDLRDIVHVDGETWIVGDESTVLRDGVPLAPDANADLLSVHARPGGRLAVGGTGGLLLEYVREGR